MDAPPEVRDEPARLQPVHVELWCPHGPEISWQVSSLRGTEALSKPYEFELQLACDDPLADAEAMLGADAELLFDRNGLTRAFYGVIAEVEIEIGDPQRPNFEGISARVRMVPAFALLEQEVDTRFFAGQTVVEILQAQLGEALAGFGRQLDVESRLSTTYNPRDYCVQFRESTFAFCSRIMEEEGISYVFVPDPDSQRERMVLVDNNEAFAAVELLVPDAVPLAPHQPEQLDRESIQRFDWRSRRTSNRVVTRGYNLKHPARFDEGEAERRDAYNPNVREQALDGDLRQIIDDPVGDPQAQSFTGIEFDQRSSQAARALERHQVEATIGRGSSNAIGFGAGRVFELGEGASATGSEHEFVLARVVHHAKLDDTTDALDHAYSNRFECIPRSRPYRPALSIPRPRVSGVQTGVVVGPPGEEAHTDALGRVKVKFHRDRHASDDEHASCWISVAQIWAGPGYGAMVLPRVGMEVVVSFVDGNPDCPLVTGCLYNGANAPPHALPAELSRSTFKTSSTPGGEGSNELRIEDAAGKEQFFVHAQRRMDVRVGGNLYETCDGDLEQIVGSGWPSQPRGDYCNLVNKSANVSIRESSYLHLSEDEFRILRNSYETCYGRFIQAKWRVQLTTPNLIVEASDQISHKANDIALAGSRDVSVKAGAKLILDSNNRIELRVGESFIAIGPGGVDIHGPVIRLNSGGEVGEAGEGENAKIWGIAHPFLPRAADDGDGGGGGGGGGGDRARGHFSEMIEVIHAPPMTPPPKVPADQLVEAGKGKRKILSIAWTEPEVWCSEAAAFSGKFDEGGASQVEVIRLKSAADGQEFAMEAAEIGAGQSFEHALTVKDVLPRQASDGRYEQGRELVATIQSVRTAMPLQLRFLTDLPSMRFETHSKRFNLRVENHEIVIGGTIDYTRGWLHYIIDLGDLVDEDTGGLIGIKCGGHEDWRFCKKSAAGGARELVYWDGADWRPVPSSWTSDLGTKLHGTAVWAEGGVTKTQWGKMPWPDPVPEWSQAALQGKDERLAEIKATIETGWTGTFDFKREQCASGDPMCCRHRIRCEINFAETAVKRGPRIILAENDGRANANAWPYDVDTNTAMHEFGHHLGNPDEYPGATSVDATVNGDGATAGIDPEGLMGDGSTLRQRYYDTIRTVFVSLVARETKKLFTYAIVTELRS